MSSMKSRAAGGTAHRRCICALLLVSCLAAASACAQTQIRSLTGVIEGHQVGGVTIDLVGNVYVADFGDLVWKITPEGERREFASGFYGASGNVIDGEGNLLQSNFYGNSIVKVDRKGQTQPFVAAGLSGPVGLAIDRQTGDVYVANCGGNSIARISTDASVSTFAKSDLLKCPNGIAFDKARNLYVVNFRNNQMLKIDPGGTVSPFASVSEKGLGHLCFKDDRFYVTAYASHEIYEVALSGTVKRILGNGERGMVDGDAAKARLSFPNGIACNPWAPRLYINEYVNESTGSLPRRAIIRQIDLEAGK
jgi:DNA-binding beta-propeller fold protein YncE